MGHEAGIVMHLEGFSSHAGPSTALIGLAERPNTMCPRRNATNHRPGSQKTRDSKLHKELGGAGAGMSKNKTGYSTWSV
jgi:hypothetical protein